MANFTPIRLEERKSLLYLRGKSWVGEDCHEMAHHRFPYANKLRKFCFMEVLNYVNVTMKPWKYAHLFTTSE